MKILKILILIFIFGFIVWVDLAETLKAKFKFIPTSLDFNVFNYKIKRHFKTHLGLDLKGGSHLVFDADTTKVKPEDLEDALNSVRDIVERRVNLFGISEPSVQTLKSGEIYRVSIDLPGITSVSDAIRLIGQTAQLSFREQASPEAKIATDTPVFLILQKETGLTGKHVKKATVTFDQQNGKPQVALSFSGEGAKIFSKITARNVGRPVGIFVDELLISAPIVQQAITDGNAVITGSFTVDEAKKLAIAINSGALPLPVKLVEQRNIGPTLGKIEVNKSVVAGGVGLLMVLIFMIGYYGKLGLIASAGLVIYGLMTLAIIKIIPVVLTLPGVAGFILSIGMAVDSNILIFERIKEELRRGNDQDIAIRLGFGRAIDAIKDANVTTLIVSFILFNPLNWDFLPQFGLVRGFALTLAIGVATSLFTGVVITRRLIDLFYKKNV